MKLAILGDLHENLRHLSIAIDEVNKIGVDMTAFVGDFDMPFSMRGFTRLKSPIKAVLGNGDPDIQKFLFQLNKLDVLKDMTLEISPRFQDFKLGNKRIGIFHGDDKMLLNFLLESQLLDLLCIGHTHIPEIKIVGKTTLINPGSFVGWFLEDGNLPIYIGLYDTETGKADLIEIDV